MLDRIAYLSGNKGDSNISNKPRSSAWGAAFWLSFILYNAAVHCLFALFWIPALLVPSFRARFFSRLGFGVPRLKGSFIVHGASAGEVLAARFFIRLLKERFPEVPVVVTAFTTTGLSAAEELGADHVLGLPYDLFLSVRVAFARLNPVGLFLVEGDYWPDFLFSALGRGVPVAVVSGRLTEKAAKRYAYARPLFGPLFARVSAYAVSNSAYVDRYLALGARPESVRFTGNIKYDDLGWPRPEFVSAVWERLGVADRLDLVVCGSTHAGEEEALAGAYLAARALRPSLRLLVAPRYPERAPAVRRLLADMGVQAALWSDGGACEAVVLDTVGDLRYVYEGAAVAVVGGSFVPRGGQNVIEPAYAGCAVLYGPHTFHFAEEVRLLDGAGGTTVPSADALPRAMERLYGDVGSLKRQMEYARRTATRVTGGSARALDFILERWETA